MVLMDLLNHICKVENESLGGPVIRVEGEQHSAPSGGKWTCLCAPHPCAVGSDMSANSCFITIHRGPD